LTTGRRANSEPSGAVAESPETAPPPGATPVVELVGATKTYGTVRAIDSVDLAIRPRELFTLLGPSGSGKTTVLRAIAGLVDLAEGQILIEGRDVRRTPTYERNIGMVFQSLALFPHMSVFDNIAFPLRMRRDSRGEIAKRVQEVLEMVRLPDIAERRVQELSGGQQQRVALARALVYDPKLLLLDEPLGALDKQLREEMQLEIVRLHRQIDVTIINVTHDQVEALMLSDRIGVMQEGRIIQVGTSEEIYRRPSTRFVAEFMGRANVIEGVGHSDGSRSWVETTGGAVVEVGRLDQSLLDEACIAVIRAEDIELHQAAPPDQEWTGVSGTVALRVFEGETVYYEIEVPGLERFVKVASRTGAFSPDEPVRLVWDPNQAGVIGVEAGAGV
jgi:putative spermidine/putrescine transport system ATP-binding protein